MYEIDDAYTDGLTSLHISDCVLYCMVMLPVCGSHDNIAVGVKYSITN